LFAEHRSSSNPNAYGDAFAEYQQSYSIGVDEVSMMWWIAIAARTEFLTTDRPLGGG
jgi:hypothetical protein